jgi:NAD(P)H-nitrite reductase large subunit
MCRSLADGLTGTKNPYTGSVTSTKLKVSGIDVFSAGDFSGGDGCEDIVLRDATRGIYKRVIVKDDKILGAVLYGDTADGNWYFDLLKKGEDISDIRDALIFGQAFASGGGATANPIDAVAALPDDAEICGCNGVSKGKVMACIAGGAHTSMRCAPPARLRQAAAVVPAWWRTCCNSRWATNSLESATPNRCANAPASPMRMCARRSWRKASRKSPP